jgi:hypothetical protein
MSGKFPRPHFVPLPQFFFHLLSSVVVWTPKTRDEVDGVKEETTLWHDLDAAADGYKQSLGEFVHFLYFLLKVIRADETIFWESKTGHL